MKKYLSVFSYYIKSNIYILILITALISAGQLLSFNYILKSSDAFINGYLLSVEKLLEINNMIPNLFYLGLVLITVMLCLCGTEFSSRQGYTLRRLRITEKEVLICQTVANFLMYAIFFLAETLVTFSLCCWYFKIAKDFNYPYNGVISNQSLFLAYYRNDFLHSLLPLSDILKYVTNFISILSLSVTGAAFPYLARRKKISLEVFILLIVICINFGQNYMEYSYDIFIIGTGLFLTGMATVRISTEEKAYEK